MARRTSAARGGGAARRGPCRRSRRRADRLRRPRRCSTTSSSSISAAFIVGTDTKARLNGSSSTNPDVDFDQTFGKASDATRIRADALVAHHADAPSALPVLRQHASTARASSTATSSGATTRSRPAATSTRETEFKIFELAYEYAFMRRPDVRAGRQPRRALHGPVAAPVGQRDDHRRERQQSRGRVHDQGELGARAAAGDRRARRLGGRAAVATSKCRGRSSRPRSTSYDGRVTDLRAGVTWMFSRNFGVGLGYNRFITTVDVDKDDVRRQRAPGLLRAPAVRDRRVLSDAGRGCGGWSGPTRGGSPSSAARPTPSWKS